MLDHIDANIKLVEYSLREKEAARCRRPGDIVRKLLSLLLSVISIAMGSPLI